MLEFAFACLKYLPEREIALSSNIKQQMEVLSHGLIDLISEKEFEEKLQSSVKNKKPLRVKYGADPSAPDIHLGHTVPLRKLREFQEFGHTVVFIIGDFTAQIGDPTERSETRQRLTDKQVKENAKTYQNQVFKILDKKKTEVRYNSEWLGKMSPYDFMNLTSQYTVARLLERDDFQKRYKSNLPITLLEFMYPLLQGYDSVEIKSDIEIGGTDQKFNLLVGRELQKTWGQTPQLVMTLPLIEGTDGVQKMSKSANNYIALEDSPQDIFGKVMSIPDALLTRYYEYVSGFPAEKIVKDLAGFKDGSLHPRNVKADLAQQIVTLYYSSDDAQKARQEFDQVFKSKGLPSDIPLVKISSNDLDLVSALKEANMISSKSEGRRLIEQGGVKIDQKKVMDCSMKVDFTDPVLVQCGKRKFAKIQCNAG